MQFSAWHPLDDAGRLAPEEPGVLQARAEDLLAYPTGRSAMVFYDASRPERTLAAHVHEEGQQALARAATLGARLVRFGASTAGSGSAARGRAPQDELGRLLASFRERFGALPLGNQQDDVPRE